MPTRNSLAQIVPESPAARKILIRRIIMTFIGIVGTGFAVGLFRFAALGMDPYQNFMGGLAATFSNVGFGTLWMIVNGLLIIIALVFKRSLIGFGTLLSLTLLGFIIDGSHQWLIDNLSPGNLLIRFGYFALGFLIVCVTAALYFSANMGVSNYDAIALILAERLPRIPFKYWRIITDSACVIIGGTLFLLAGNSLAELTGLLSIGTIIVALCMGPLIQLFRDRFTDPLVRNPEVAQG